MVELFQLMIHLGLYEQQRQYYNSISMIQKLFKMEHLMLLTLVILQNEISIITFNNNNARENGGVLHSVNSALAFTKNSTILLNYKAMLNGGAMCII